MANEMSHCLCIIVTSRALSSVDDMHVVQMFVKGSSAMYSVTLISFSIECFWSIMPGLGI